MPQVPTAEQHRALLNDCWELARALPTSGVFDRGRKPYRARRLERKLAEVEQDPIGLLEYVRGMARRTSEGLDLLVEYNRGDLSIETLIIERSKIYAPLFTPEDRAAAESKLTVRTGQVADVAKAREQNLNDERAGREERARSTRRPSPATSPLT